MINFSEKHASSKNAILTQLFIVFLDYYQSYGEETYLSSLINNFFHIFYLFCISESKNEKTLHQDFERLYRYYVLKLKGV